MVLLLFLTCCLLVHREFVISISSLFPFFLLASSLGPSHGYCLFLVAEPGIGSIPGTFQADLQK